MDWITLTTSEEVRQIAERSQNRPQVIFKHSTRCSVSDMAKARLERAINDLAVMADVYYLDLIRYRETSNFIAEFFGVKHESPQVLVIRNGKCILEQSHYDIRPEEMIEVLTIGIKA
jgi:bacillithiol system protein YtxJ